MSTPRLFFCITAFLFAFATWQNAKPIEVYPACDEGFSVSLNGDWSFKFIDSGDAGSDADFADPAFDVSDWESIRVPGNWEMQGFSAPRYAKNSFQRDFSPILGLYRRTFTIPADWSASHRRVILRFEGVQNGFTIWVNGHEIGSSTASAYNPHSFDITDALNPGTSQQQLAVKVSTQPLGWEFDINDDWALSGIMRDVTLFSVPQLHLRGFTTSTQLASNGSARFTVKATTSRSGGQLTATLISPAGSPVATLPLTPSAEFQISSPQLWTAETPDLYRLRIDVADADGHPLQAIEDRVGLREVSIANGVLMLNGSPIKLRGVNHHDLEPATGRTLSPQGMRRDIELMQAANINYVRTSHYPPDPRFIKTEHVWLDATTYLDTYGEYGSDGIVYADRTPQPAYWLVRKVYSPVQIAASSLPVCPGRQTLSVPVENRHDFIPLSGFKLVWHALRNGASLAKGTEPLSAAAHAQETLEIPLQLSAEILSDDVLALELRVFAPDGEPVVERTLRLDLAGENRERWPHTLLTSPSAPVVTEEAGRILISTSNASVTVDRGTGSLSILDPAGKQIVNDLRPHAGRNTSYFERLLVRDTGMWNTALLDDPQDVAVTVKESASAVAVRVSGHHPRPGSPEEALIGYYEAEITANGVIRIRYDYRPENATGYFPEAGLTLVLPEDETELRWIGLGPWAGYPGMDRHNEFGIHHLNRADIRFDGNRRGVELALLTSPEGRGIALSSPSTADVAVDRYVKQTLLRHNALISGVGNKNWKAETAIEASEAASIRGEFTLVPLDTNWPSPLVRWFGEAGTATDIQQPFYHSYDQ
ncbi:MAG: evolved beta-galactosidase subunit alpha [Puniceicoccaceae bacterium 5H]|nr:MAG: evolved beta-galactosidase subunit alpha [Puniceicoccaceae bacterium 5H]